MIACPKPEKVRTSKRKKRAAKNVNIRDVRCEVADREMFECRFYLLLERFGMTMQYTHMTDGLCELAHLDDRGMGGNPDLSRDTTENTILLARLFHQGPFSKHSGHLKVRALTDKGADGPLCFEIYEQLPTEISYDR